ncbi:TIP120-domain-containing protein [Rozella allomycis CSF55]|uniref:TATA-binding protein interacting (TIP20) domain-containing protein n=1 Tax=Rozella allomycis (strain CSF55) TaxID=988480 RepID=A0A075B286_ROZAC|nr:TATA-binding protein interacting (TIP20) domain-containing protein [Rozella allomycis CSF55]RKP18533.1 TIP120-domain-containing protein [Rozella allomycis CSF55]|eukprot:EPZ36685.1 TATA-binding protein interacting (TIP20) domain-containing protein [Rozella allomycis CSF55]
MSISTILDKVKSHLTWNEITSVDKDYRYMALVDIKSFLTQKNLMNNRQCDAVVKAILDCLKDDNHEVQNMSIHLGALVEYEKQRMGEVFRFLGEMVNDKEDERREIAVMEVQGKNVESLLKLLIPFLQIDEEGKIVEALELMINVSARYSLYQYEMELVDVLKKLIMYPRVLIRKKSIAVCGNVMGNASLKFFDEIVKYVAKDLDSSSNLEYKTTDMILLSGMCRSNAECMKNYSQTLVKKTLDFVKNVKEDEEFLESCLNFVESVSSSNFSSISCFSNEIFSLIEEFIKFDPNYFEEDLMEEDYEEEEEEEEYTDDEDLSWKVRKAALRLTATFSSINKDLNSLLFNILIVRLNERNENILTNVIQALLIVIGNESLDLNQNQVDSFKKFYLNAIKKSKTVKGKLLNLHEAFIAKSGDCFLDYLIPLMKNKNLRIDAFKIILQAGKMNLEISFEIQESLIEKDCEEICFEILIILIENNKIHSNLINNLFQICLENLNMKTEGINSILKILSLIFVKTNEFDKEIPKVSNFLIEQLKRSPKAAMIDIFTQMFNERSNLEFKDELFNVLINLLGRVEKDIRVASLHCLICIVEKFNVDYIQILNSIENILRIESQDLNLMANLSSICFQKNPNLIYEKEELINLLKENTNLLNLISGIANLSFLEKLFYNIFSIDDLDKVGKLACSLCLNNSQLYEAVLTRMIEILNSQTETEMNKKKSLVLIGELGKNFNIFDKTFQMVSECTNEECLRSVASNTLGFISSFNVESNLPLLLEFIKTSNFKSSLFKSLINLISIKKDEILSTEPILNLLMNEIESDNEPNREAAAEVLSQFYLIDHNAFYSLISHLLSQSENHKLSALIALRTAAPLLDSIEQPMKMLIPIIGDPIANVNKNALSTLKSFIHWKPSQIGPFADSLASKLFDETKIKQDLIKEIQMGPFKHNVDQGLDSRKLTFECLYSLNNLSLINTSDFINTLIDGLNDDNNIKLYVLFAISKLSASHQSAIISKLEKFINPLKDILNVKLKDNSVKQEQETHLNLVKATIKCAVHLEQCVKNSKSLGIAREFDIFYQDEIVGGKYKAEYIKQLENIMHNQ